MGRSGKKRRGLFLCLLALAAAAGWIVLFGRRRYVTVPPEDRA